MSYLDKMLTRSRANLIAAQEHLHIARTLGNHPPEYRARVIRLQEKFVCDALDRAWNMECMARTHLS